MLTKAELEAERAASKARCDARRAAEPPNTPDPYIRTSWIAGLGRKDPSWFDDVYIPPMDVTEVMW
jgi:hypothetical protein